MINIDDHTKEDGSVDWNSYNQAKIDNGDACYRCESVILFGEGFKRLCGNCNRLSLDGEIHHKKFVRCPSCRHSWNPSDSDDYQFFEEGEHELTCPICEHEFEISTQVSYNFTSPEVS